MGGRAVDGRADPKGDFRDAISLLATGVTVITTVTSAGPVGMTASAVCSLSVEPVQLLVCISSSLPTHEALESAGSFAVNVLGEGQEALAMRFATPGVDRFAQTPWHEVRGLPVLDPAIAHFACRVRERFPGGDHSIFIGEVERCGHARGSRPLLYFDRGFGALEAADAVLQRNWIERGAIA